MLMNTNGNYADIGEAVIFSDGRFNYQMDSQGKTMPKEPGTAGAAFVAVRQKTKDQCETFYGSQGIERTTLSRSNIIAGIFALKSVLHEMRCGDWKTSGIKRVIFVTRSPYLYETLAQNKLFLWQRHDWMVRYDGVLSERPNKDLWEDMLAVLNDYQNMRIEVDTQFLEKENYPVLNTLVENPIKLAQQASDGNSPVKDQGFEKILASRIQNYDQFSV